jgi:hypothetical protein
MHKEIPRLDDTGREKDECRWREQVPVQEYVKAVLGLQGKELEARKDY